MKESKLIPSFIEALDFASYRHRQDKTKNEEPYINHIIHVCKLISVTGEINDPEVLMAAALHDILEKTETRPNEINFEFGEEVFRLVTEVTNHHEGNEEEKFREQLEGVGALSPKARIIRLADKIANVKAVLSYPPESWDIEKRSYYINWADRIIRALSGTNKNLEDYYEEMITQGQKSNLYTPESEPVEKENPNG